MKAREQALEADQRSNHLLTLLLLYCLPLGHLNAYVNPRVFLFHSMAEVEAMAPYLRIRTPNNS